MEKTEALVEHARDLWDEGSLRMSERLYTVAAGPCYGIFQSVFHTAHFIDDQAYQVLREFGSGYSFPDLERLRRKYGYGKDEFYKLMLYCIKNHLLVENDSEEKSYIDLIRSRYDTPPQCETLYIFPTLDCNLTCSYCLVKRGNHDTTNTKMSIAVAQQGVDFLADISGGSPKHIIFYGGEPLLHFELIRYVVEYVQRWGHTSRFKFSPPRMLLVTNGTLLTAEMARFFALHDVQVAVSLDGLPESQNTVRSSKGARSSFDGALGAIRELEQAGASFNISLTLNRRNIETTPAFIRWMSDNISCRNLGMNFLQFCGTNRDLFAGPPEDTELLDEIYDTIEQYGMFEESVEKMMVRIECGQPSYAHCNAQGSQIVLLPNGTAIPCQGLAGVTGAGVPFKNGSDPMDSPLFREWAFRTPYHIPECYDACNIFSVCGGRCAYDALMATGNLQKVDPVNCEVAQYLFKRALKTLAKSKFAEIINQEMK